MSLQELVTVLSSDNVVCPILAREVNISENEDTLPMHQHENGQLVLTLKGNVTCRVEGDIWLVPPQCAIWVPPNTLHCTRVAVKSSVCILFIQQEYIKLPHECCTLSISPLVCEIIRHISSLQNTPEQTEHRKLLIQVLLTELAMMPITNLNLPISDDVRLHHIAEKIVNAPSDRKTIDQWASEIGMSRRSLMRMVTLKTGMSFGKWKQQLQLIIAIQKLSEGVTVQQTAWDLGYESVTAFITMFKKALGVSPTKYIQPNVIVD